MLAPPRGSGSPARWWSWVRGWRRHGRADRRPGGGAGRGAGAASAVPIAGEVVELRASPYDLFRGLAQSDAGASAVFFNELHAGCFEGGANRGKVVWVGCPSTTLKIHDRLPGDLRAFCKVALTKPQHGARAP